ncbi:Hamartin protein-domain-containing protein [Neurospora tetraspora]|uniref:Hamartin protein-domain-containing protein n=1 Tax=Neurospora tetraspora TaxID=94610 RepID=A0AAE0MPG2_9PEZI|nr:Hamartin protein-domain-containing protein [Neurospora tetraspora]
MASSGSTKDLTKALTSFIQTPNLPLPDELTTLISNYLDRHEHAEDGAADRLNEELLSIYTKNVENQPGKYAAFLAILRELRPAMKTPARIFEWWDRLLDPVLEYVGQEKGLAREVATNTLDLLMIDQFDESSNSSEASLAPFTERLLSRWMDARASQINCVPMADFKDRMVKRALMAFGKKDPKGFMTCLDRYFVKREYRNFALSLLCDFVQSQPPHLHVVLQTPLFNNILNSLQKDESTATVTMALVALIMLLPYIPSSLVPFLSKLFNIYARLLFWDRDSYFAQEHTEIGPEGGSNEVTWERVLLDPDHDGSSIPYLSGYFTVLYGLYPINFLDYIRKPQRYLRHANNDDDIDVQAMEIRDRSERFRKQHLLHPNFYNLTIDSEKTDMSRWLNSEADEVLAECMALSLESKHNSSDARNTTPLPVGLDHVVGEELGDDDMEAILNGSLDRGGISSGVESTPSIVRSQVEPSREPSLHGPTIDAGSQQGDSTNHVSDQTSLGGQEVAESPIISPHQLQSSPHTQLHDRLVTYKASISGLRQSLANASVPSLALGTQEVVGDKSQGQVEASSDSLNQPPRTGEANNYVSLLYHQNLLLLNDLQFERYIKQQHMIHMGELRRKQVREAATEAETQNLVMANRSLRQRLDEAKRGEAQVKKEFDHRRNIAKKWESDLSTKLRALREEQKKWAAEELALKHQLEECQRECERLRSAADLAEKTMLQYKQSNEAIDISTEEIDRLKGEVARLTESERAYHGKELKMQQAIQSAALAEARAEQLSQQVTAHELQIERVRKHYESRIADLSDQLAKVGKESQSRNVDNVVAVFESALATSRAKQMELQKECDILKRKCTELEGSLLELRSANEELSSKILSNDSQSALLDGGPEAMTPRSGSPIISRTANRGFSDTDSLESIFRSATPSLIPATRQSSVSSPTSVRRPGTPPGAGVSGDTSSRSSQRTSPVAERHHGKGVLANALKKERKDKKEDKPEKKKSSLPAFKGMRGFV